MAIVNKYSNGGGSSSGGTYVLPVATASRLGGIKVGSGLTIDSGGTLSASGGSSEKIYYYHRDVIALTTDEKKALWDKIAEEYNSGYTIYFIAEDYSGEKKILPLVGYVAETNPSTHTGGKLQFASLTMSGNFWNKIEFKSDGGINPNSQNFNAQVGYTLPKASSSTLGGVKVGSGLTIDSGGTLSVSGGTGGGGSEQIYVINDIIEDSAATAEFYTLMRNAISGGTAEGWDFKVFYRYKFFGMNDTMCPLQNAWISDYNAFGNENVELVFETNGYAFAYGSQINDYVLIDIASDGSAAVDNHPGQTMPSNYQRIINVTSAGTFVNADELAVFAEENYMHKVIFKWVEENDGVEWGQAPLKYVYRQYETVDDTPHLIYYFCAEVPVNGTIMVGHWHADENNWQGYTLDSWASPYIQP